MPTLRKRVNVGVVLLSALLGVHAGPLCAADAVADAPSPITQQEVDDAIAKVRSDPNMAQERTVQKLRWRDDEQDAKEEEAKKKDEQANAKNDKRSSNSFVNWIRDLFSFLAQTGRVIVWLAVAALIAVLVVAIIRLARSFRREEKIEAFVAPSHVRDLDIRPESLPEDIGTTAWRLWEQGEHRAALALLYRGLLSRLAHTYRVPIKHSSTEGDCLTLAQAHLQNARADYAQRLIRVWQRAVYGAQEPDTIAMQALCSEFTGALAPPDASVRA